MKKILLMYKSSPKRMHKVNSEPQGNYDNDSYDEAEENFRNIEPDEEDKPYFPPEDSKPPHY